MTPFTLIMVGALLAAPPGAARPFPLRLEPGQEFVYHANYERESGRPGSRFTCYLRTYVLILDARPDGARAAFLTVQRLEAKGGAEPVPIARLALGRIDPLGRVTLESAGTRPRLPIDAPPTLETYPFLELPPGAEAGRTWDVEDAEYGRQSWSVVAIEPRDHGRCLKLRGEQSAGDWSVVGRLAWSRKELVSVLMQDGYVDHAERKTSWRTESGERYESTTVIDLDAPPAPMPRGEFDKRQAEVRDALRFAERLAELTRPRGEPDYRGYDDLLRALDRYRDRGTPYAAAVKSLRRQAELARRGERPPEPIIIPSPGAAEPAAPRRADVDQPAPDLTLRDAQTGSAVPLASLRGQPVVLVFFKPSSKLNGHVLGYVRAAAQAYERRVQVLALAVDGDRQAVARLKADFGLECAVYDGREAVSAFGGKTPRVAVIDPAGVVRVIAPGWGGEYPDWLHKELVKILQAK